MISTKYVVDTYAVIEYIKGNKKYLEVLNEATSLHTTEFMLAELYYILLRETTEENADNYFERFAQYLTRTTESELKQAMRLRLKLKKQRFDISYTDAIGYQKALELNASFLTGDPAFENRPNVEFIK
ncbi:MAG: PIN domain-containing protein [Candidatus Micrarchaeota archaeon]